jgi:hypothetical protein
MVKILKHLIMTTIEIILTIAAVCSLVGAFVATIMYAIEVYKSRQRASSSKKFEQMLKEIREDKE